MQMQRHCLEGPPRCWDRMRTTCYRQICAMYGEPPIRATTMCNSPERRFALYAAPSEEKITHEVDCWSWCQAVRLELYARPCKLLLPPLNGFRRDYF